MNKKLSAEISRLIAARILNLPLTETEKQTLDQWLQASEKNRQCFNEIKNLNLATKLLSMEQNGYGEKMAERFKQQVYPSLRKRKSSYLYKYAAVALILIFIGTGLYFFNQSNSQLEHQQTACTIIPGNTKAVLRLADGQTRFINDQQKQEINQIIDSVSQSEQLTTKKQIPLHTLSVPRGGEFRYTLSDGTTVWLNSDTELRFPSSFSNDNRHVYLAKGEAYFDVTKDQKRPFIVSTSQGDIQVYGTQFNISNYTDTPFTTVLVKGSIGFKSLKGKELLLKPSQKLTVDKTSQEVNIETVDTSLYTAWTQHLFVFKEQTLEEIMKSLSRWYDFTPIFQSDDIRKIRLSGRLYRHEDIRKLLDNYEITTGINFSIEQNNIIISK